MEINESLLRKYIFYNQVLRIHNEAVAETYLAPTKCKEIKYCINCGQKLDWD